MPTVDGLGRPGQYGPGHNCAFVLVSGSSVTCSYKNRIGDIGIVIAII